MFSLLVILLLPLLLGALVLLLQRKSYPATTLLFHHITSKKYVRSLSEITESQFKAFCKRITQSKFETTTISDRNSEKQLAITFDDGLKSNLKAATILEQYDLHATFYICTAELTNEATTDVYSPGERLNKDDIKQLHSKGFEIGSHTVHHLDLRLLSQDDLINELQKSKSQLEEIIGSPLTSLSIPYGLWNDRVIDTAIEIGYTSVVVYNFTNKSKRYPEVIPSTGIYPFDSIKDIEQKISGIKGNGIFRAHLIPHFAKGSPLAAFSKLYRKLPLPWFTNGK